MNNSLKIKKFKRIYDEIELSQFDFVNYFVGRNSSGKTSILNSISYLNDGSNAGRFFGTESIVELNYELKKQSLFRNSKHENVYHKGDLKPNIFLLLSNIEQEKGANGLKSKTKFDDSIKISSQESLKELNDFFKEIGHNEITARKILNKDDPFDRDNGKLVFETDKGSLDPYTIADGLRVLFNFKKYLLKWLSEFSKSSSVNLAIIEEPENNLHPDFQKKIPIILNNIYKKLDDRIRPKVHFFISTHSPFIISSSSFFDNQKVYPLESGKPLTIDFSENSWFQTTKSKGYKGSQCAYVVSKMLGAEISDLGYPENYCILEEYSLQLILESARKKGLIKNIQFVSASGVSKQLDLYSTIYEIEKINTLIKCNPYYFDKYFLITDNTKNFKDKKIQSRLKKISDKLGNRFIELSLDSLEDFYENIDIKIFNDFKNQTSISKKENLGIIKAKFASLISEKIITTNDFSTLFNRELDFLLKK